MKKIVPLKKDLSFKSPLSEITSISLDHNLKLDNRTIRGNLIISGSYKSDITIEDFNYSIPVNIEMSDRYELDDLNISIEDFFYEIVNDNILSVDVEIALSGLNERVNPIKYEDDIVVPVSSNTNIFNNLNEEYAVYKVYVVKENDTVESIMLNYNITKEVLEEYNNINDIKIGDKIIIPSLIDENK